MTLTDLLAFLPTLGISGLMLVALTVLPALVAAIHCLKNKGIGSTAKTLWLLGIVFIPPLGTIVYAFSGVEPSHSSSTHL